MGQHPGILLSLAAVVAAGAGLSCVTQAGAPAPASPVVAVAVAVPAAVPVAAAAEEPEAEGEEEAARGGEVISSLGPLRIGQPAAEVTKLLGEPSRVVTDDEEADGWRRSGYDPDQELVFLLGFDELLVYDNEPEGLPPYWKFFIRGGRVMMIKASGFVANPEKIKDVGFAPACYLTAPAEGVVKTFGRADAVADENEGKQQVYTYLNRGISVIVVDGAIQVFDIFGALSVKERQRLRGAIKGSGQGRR